MIKSLLIANRGEIACRILRTTQRLGIRSVVVYSEADAKSLAIELADEAYALGPSPASESYLNIEAILHIAKKAKVEAIHPGYGFLSENEAFAKACLEAGFIFIGPSLDSLKRMGSKSEAKAIAQKLDIPIIPRIQGNDADRLAYPLMIKALMGGGGKGMRRVDSKEEFQQALEACEREALSSFGNKSVMLEKYIDAPRHIEVQLFGDIHGNLVHLFERECSLQRRHQKIIEEAPSSLSSPLKNKLYEAALKIGREIHYVNAGTIEFLVDKNNHFYFMEMNTRLQVEHPVTEAITGLDLVEWQILVASGEKLPLTQDKIKQHGNALELRLYAEDPQQDFKPITGDVWMKASPEDARIDTGLHPLDTITPYYDPLLAKLILWGENRPQAIEKAQAALNQWKILGLKTNVSFLKRILKDEDFLNNHLDIELIDRKINLLTAPHPTPEYVYLAASLITALGESENSHSPWNVGHKWRLQGYAPLHFEWSSGAEIQSVTLTYSPEGWIYDAHGPLQASVKDNVLYFLNEQIPFWEMGGKISLSYLSETYTLTPYFPSLFSSHKKAKKSNLNAPMTGKVVLILVSEGEEVKEGQPLLILEAMKMEHMISAPRKGKIKHIFYHVGDIVEEGADLITLREEEETSHELTKVC
jgi:3-methylcrotonyl-CoA carboxylase alpha subunit